MNQEILLHFSDEEFLLLAQKAIYWKSRQAILISDLHLGKATHFIKNGISMPADNGKKDLLSLTRLIEIYNAKELFILGDLFHSVFNKEWEWFSAFVDRHPLLQIILIKGNHDLLPEQLFQRLNIQVVSAFQHEKIMLSHNPQQKADTFCICGHIHPGIKLKGKAKQLLKLPCFYVTDSMCVMPAFGSLTGLELVQPKKGDKVFVVATNQIIPVNAFN